MQCCVSVEQCKDESVESISESVKSMSVLRCVEMTQWSQCRCRYESVESRSTLRGEEWSP